MRVCAVGVTRRRDVFCHSNRRANQNAGREKHEVQSAVQTGYMGNEIGPPVRSLTYFSVAHRSPL